MWSLLLYISIPCALLLLAVILFCHGVFQRLNDMAMLLVGRFIFGRFNVLPFPLIQMLLVLHALSALWMGINVYYWHSNHPAPSHTAHHTISLEYNAKAWRKQRNLYLLCLSLVLWWSARLQPHTTPHTTLHTRSHDC